MATKSFESKLVITSDNFDSFLSILNKAPSETKKTTKREIKEANPRDVFTRFNASKKG